MNKRPRSEPKKLTLANAVLGSGLYANRLDETIQAEER
jgi:hypothetical protein